MASNTGGFDPTSAHQLELDDASELFPLRKLPAPGKVTLTSRLRTAGDEGEAPHPLLASSGVATVRADGGRLAAHDPFSLHLIAAGGVADPGVRLPHLDTIQRAFGHHDVSGAHAHVGGAAAEATAQLGAPAYAIGNQAAFAAAPDLRQAAHEAAHLVQARGDVSFDGGRGSAGDAHERHADAVAERVVRGESAAALLDAGPGASPDSAGGLPYQHDLQRAFGQDFSEVEVRLGDAGGSGEGALASHEGGRDVVAFDRTSPSREQVAHELTHVVQRRQFGEGRPGHSQLDDPSEREARDVGALAAAGHRVEVHAAPASSLQRDDDVASRIHDKLNGTFLDDEAGALGELRRDDARGATCRTYQARYSCSLWGDFIENASGDILHQALALLWPHMTLVQRLSTHLGVDDDEASILQTIRNASDAEVRDAREEIQPYLDELDVADQYTARCRVWPEQAVENVVWLLSHGDGVFWDDEGPVATAIMNLTPAQRAVLYRDHYPGSFSMFSDGDRIQIRRMLVTDEGTAATDADAARVRMELATDGPGTDEDGVNAAIGTAGARRDELAACQEMERTGLGADGEALTTAQIEANRRRIAEIGGVVELMTPNADGSLGTDSFLGRVAGDMDAGTLDVALTTAHVDAFTRAKQALLTTLGETGIDVDEEAALRILRDLQGNVDLAEGETIESLGAAEVSRRRADSAHDIRRRLREDPALAPVWAALSEGAGSETEYADAITAGRTYDAAIHELTDAYEGIDTDEARILRIIRDLSAEDRTRLRTDEPPILGRIRSWGLGPSFISALDGVLATGIIPADHALDAAMGGWGDGTDEDMVTDVLATLTPEERALYRRGYLVAHTRDLRADRVCAPGISLPPDDQVAFDTYTRLRARLSDELTDEELDQAMATLIGVPSAAELRATGGLVDAATIMLLRQRERLQMSAGATDLVTTTDDTAASAHVEFEARYNQAMVDGEISEDGFMVLVRLDTEFNARFQEYADTANIVSEIAGTVAAVVIGVVVILASGPAAPLTASGVIAWVSANSTLLAGSAIAGALTQVAVSEAAGGDFNEALDADGARQALSGALNGLTIICGAALAERAATLVGLSGPSLTAAIARVAAGAADISVPGRAVARGALTGLIDGSLGGAVGELAMTLTDAETWRRSVWDVMARAGASLLRGGLLGGVSGAAAGSLVEGAQTMLRGRVLARVLVEIDSELDNTARVSFDINDDGSLDNLALRFGATVSDADLAAHVERVVEVERASRLLVRARALTTTSGHAEQEAIKIRRMIEDRMRQLRTALSPESRDLAQAELDVLEDNLDHFDEIAEAGDTSPGSGSIDQPTAPFGYPRPPRGHYYRRRGSGWDLQLYPDADPNTPRFTLEPNGRGGWRRVAREGASASESAVFDEGTTAEQAFDMLTGANSRSSFKQYWEMLRDNGLATRQQVIDAMLNPSGRTEDSVRHALKESFRPRVMARTVRSASGRILTEAESMVELRRLTEGLNSSDRGNLTEAWYASRRAGLDSHPTMSRDDNPDIDIEGRGGNGRRFPDFVESSTVVEVKSTGSGLDAEEVVQINDDLAVAAANGQLRLRDGTMRNVDSVRLVFRDIEGARGAATQLDNWIRGNDNFTVEVFGSTGTAVRINSANLSSLMSQHGVSSLRALLGAL